MESSPVKINRAKAVTGSANYRTAITIREHTIIGDEPLKAGGNNEGPTAHELLVASLASCTSVTLRMYADKKGWKLNRVEVDAEMQRITESGVQRNIIVTKITLDGDLDDEQRKRLLDISGKCPVHKTLRSSFSISQQLV
ncbi:MAG TPA: OsmC family protein [Bacteroidia bacterium]|nr:OsmC family protein [Bacteroidia bacterium]